jgi:HEAT repeat protein
MRHALTTRHAPTTRHALTTRTASAAPSQRRTRRPAPLLAVALLAVVSGCATLPDQARIKRRAESIVWGALGDPDPALRLRATRLASELGDPLLARGLDARLADAAPAVRVTAAVALARTKPAAAAILRAALDGSDGPTRALAIDGLDALSDGKARLARLAGDSDATVRARAASALGALHPPAAHALLSSLAHDGDAGVRGQALLALGALDEKAALGEVVAALADPSLGVRLAALAALLRLGHTELDARLQTLAAGPDRYLALRATVQLAHAARRLPASGRATVQAAAGAADPALRVAAMNAAGELGASGRALALAALDDNVLDVRLAAARALLAIGPATQDEPARVALRAALAGPRALDAAEELARAGDATGIARLRAAADSADAALRRDALARLSPLLSARARLIAALDDSDADIRVDAASALLRRILR